MYCFPCIPAVSLCLSLCLSLCVCVCVCVCVSEGAHRARQVVLSLLDLGCDPNEADELGQRPLHLVAKAGRAALALALIAKGAVVCPRDKRGRTPLHWVRVGG